MCCVNISISNSLIKSIIRFLWTNNTACVLYRVTLHFFKPNVTEAYVATFTKVILACHTTIFFKEISIFVGTNCFWVREFLCAAIIVDYTGNSAPMSSSVVKTFGIFACNTWLFHWEGSCLRRMVATTVQTKFKNNLIFNRLVFFHYCI